MADKRLENLARRIQKLREDQRMVEIVCADGSRCEMAWLDAVLLIIDNWDGIVDVDGSKSNIDTSILRSLLRPAD